MDSIDIIASCMVVLTVMASLLGLALLALVLRTFSAMRRVEGHLETLKNELAPILSEGRKTAEYVREMGVMARHQFGRSEPLVEETVRNVHDITVRVRESVDGATVILSALGKLAGAFSRGK